MNPDFKYKAPFRVVEHDPRGMYVQSHGEDLILKEAIAIASRQVAGFLLIIDANGIVVADAGAITESEISGPSDPITTMMADPREEGLLDFGEKSSVPFSMIVTWPTPDIDPKGRETFHACTTHKDLDSIVETLDGYFDRPGVVDALTDFIAQVFGGVIGAHRCEVLVSDWSVKIYKHPTAD